jgi:hypothetical protein
MSAKAQNIPDPSKMLDNSRKLALEIAEAGQAITRENLKFTQTAIEQSADTLEKALAAKTIEDVSVIYAEGARKSLEAMTAHMTLIATSMQQNLARFATIRV